MRKGLAWRWLRVQVIPFDLSRSLSACFTACSVPTNKGRSPKDMQHFSIPPSKAHLYLNRHKVPECAAHVTAVATQLYIHARARHEAPQKAIACLLIFRTSSERPAAMQAGPAGAAAPGAAAPPFSKLFVYRSGLRLYLVGYSKSERTCRILKLDHHDRPILQCTEVRCCHIFPQAHIHWSFFRDGSMITEYPV